MKYGWRLVLAILMLAMVSTAGAAAEKEKAMTAMGKVTAVAGDTLTIAGKGAESMTFTVDSSTKITGKGLSTKTAEKAASGEKMTLTDSINKDDMVSVTYHDMGGKMHASAVKVTQRALTAK